MSVSFAPSYDSAKPYGTNVLMLFLGDALLNINATFMRTPRLLNENLHNFSVGCAFPRITPPDAVRCNRGAYITAVNGCEYSTTTHLCYAVLKAGGRS